MRSFYRFLHNWFIHSSPIVWREPDQTGYAEWRIYDPVTGLLADMGIPRSSTKDIC